MVVRVDDEVGVLVDLEGSSVVFALALVAVDDEDEDVLEGMMVARDAGRVVCPEVKTAHAPDKTKLSARGKRETREVGGAGHDAPAAASAESQLTVTQPVNCPTNTVLLVPQ